MPRNPTPPKPPPSPIYFPISSCLCLREHASARSNRTMSWSLAAHRRIVLRSKVRRPLFLSLPAFFFFSAALHPLAMAHWCSCLVLAWPLTTRTRAACRPASRPSAERPSPAPARRPAASQRPANTAARPASAATMHAWRAPMAWCGQPARPRDSPRPVSHHRPESLRPQPPCMRFQRKKKIETAYGPLLHALPCDLHAVKVVWLHTHKHMHACSLHDSFACRDCPIPGCMRSIKRNRPPHQTVLLGSSMDTKFVATV